MPNEADLELLKKNLDCEFEELVGKSSLGTLYRVWHKVYGICALKHLDGTLTDNQQILQNLNSEVEKAKKVDYSRFAKIYEVGYHPCPYMLREWVAGENLQEYLHNKKLTPLQATRLMIEVAWGLQSAYNFGARHKNLKPANVLIKEDYTAVVVDALMPPTAPGFLSPEHCAGKSTSMRSDIYSLGAIYYQALTGRPPFRGSAGKVMRRHLEAKPPAILSLPACIAEILDKTLAKDPVRRYQNPLELIEALKRACKNLMGVETVSTPVGAEDGTSEVSKTDGEEGDRENTMMVCIQDSMQRQDGTGEITSDIASEIEALEENAEAIGEAMEAIIGIETESDEKQEEIASCNIDWDELEIEEIDDTIFIEHDRENLPKDLPEYLQKALLLATDVKILKHAGETLTSLNIFCSKKWREQACGYLQTVLRRECWVTKELDGTEQIEIIVDLELAKTLRYFNYFDDRIQYALQELPELSTIHKSVITHMESLQEDEIFKLKKTSGSVTHSTLSSIFSMFDTVSEPKLDSPVQADKDHDGEIDEEIDLTGLIDDTHEIPIELPEDQGRDEGTVNLAVNFNNPYQTRAWFKLVKEYNWKSGKHFHAKKQGERQKLKNMCFSISLQELQEYNKKQLGISSIKEFFQGDYDLARLDQGGMAAVLKLTTKNESNVILLRPENHWARQKFAPYLCVRKKAGEKEFVYADVPRGTEFCVKVAFEGREEELIYEARLLFSMAQEPDLARHVIGIVQQGSFLASESENEKEQVGYYLMLEHASLGNLEQFSRRFPENRLPVAAAFVIMYGLVKTLGYLEQKGIIHRDIKPHNILLDGDGIVKLSDFGLAITVSEAGTQLNEERRRLLRLVDKEFLQITSEKEQAEGRLKRLRSQLERRVDEQGLFEKISYDIVELYEQIEGLIKDERARAEGLKARYRPMSAEEIALKGEFAGSLYYAAPEQFSPSKVLTCACDTYQLAAVFYRMLCGKPPVKGKNVSQVMGEIVLGKKPRITDVLDASPLVNAISDFIFQMMENDPEQRISIKQVQNKMDEIAMKFSPELETEPDYEQIKDKSGQEIINWREKVKYSRKFHLQILPELQELIENAEKKGLIWKQHAKKIVKSVYISLPNKPGRNIRFRCPNCKCKLQLPPEKLGRKIRCPKCQQRLVAKAAQ